MKQMNRQQSGFTLIELVMVIVILGILAATALPKFVDLSSDAKNSAASGVAGALSSAAAINYAGCAAKNFVATVGVCVKVANCTDVGALVSPAVPVANITAAAIAAAGTDVTCTVTVNTIAKTFTAIGA